MASLRALPMASVQAKGLREDAALNRASLPRSSTIISPPPPPGSPPPPLDGSATTQNLYCDHMLAEYRARNPTQFVLRTSLIFPILVYGHCHKCGLPVNSAYAGAVLHGCLVKLTFLAE